MEENFYSARLRKKFEKQKKQRQIMLRKEQEHQFKNAMILARQIAERKFKEKFPDKKF